jgi:hypothetical protein
MTATTMMATHSLCSRGYRTCPGRQCIPYRWAPRHAHPELVSACQCSVLVPAAVLCSCFAQEVVWFLGCPQHPDPAQLDVSVCRLLQCLSLIWLLQLVCAGTAVC